MITDINQILDAYHNLRGNNPLRLVPFCQNFDALGVGVSGQFKQGHFAFYGDLTFPLTGPILPVYRLFCLGAGLANDEYVLGGSGFSPELFYSLKGVFFDKIVSFSGVDHKVIFNGYKIII